MQVYLVIDATINPLSTGEDILAAFASEKEALEYRMGNDDLVIVPIELYSNQPSKG